MRKLLGPRARPRRRLQDEGEDPDYRFSLANERTFLAWVRTALALLAGGIALLQLAPDVGSRGERLLPSVALIVLGTVLAAMSHRRWYRNERAMRLGRTLPRSAQIPLLGYGAAAIAVAALVLVAVAGSRGGR
jgi:putative membrane protein